MTTPDVAAACIGHDATADVEVFDSARMCSADVFKLLIGSVVPRPIAWVSTAGADGTFNLAPFSFFTVVSTTPPMLSLTVERRDNGLLKDTARNIQDTGEFVVNVAPSGLAKAVYESSGDYDPGTDEFTKAGVTPADSLHISAPRIAESPISMECILEHVFHPGSDMLVIGRVVAFQVRRSVIDHRGHIEFSTVDPLARLAAQFARIGSPFSLGD